MPAGCAVERVSDDEEVVEAEEHIGKASGRRRRRRVCRCCRPRVCSARSRTGSAPPIPLPRPAATPSVRHLAPSGAAAAGSKRRAGLIEIHRRPDAAEQAGIGGGAAGGDAPSSDRRIRLRIGGGSGRGGLRRLRSPGVARRPARGVVETSDAVSPAAERITTRSYGTTMSSAPLVLRDCPNMPSCKPSIPLWGQACRRQRAAPRS